MRSKIALGLRLVVDRNVGIIIKNYYFISVNFYLFGFSFKIIIYIGK